MSIELLRYQKSKNNGVVHFLYRNWADISTDSTSLKRKFQKRYTGWCKPPDCYWIMRCVTLNDFQNMEKPSGFFNHFSNKSNIRIWLILPFALRIFFPAFISRPRRTCWCQTWAATSRKDWKWVLTAKTNEMGGEGGGEDYLSVSSTKLLLHLLMEFSSFLPFQPVWSGN